MKNEIKVPSMGESISEVTVGQILVSSGSVVKADEEILELETDKVNQVLYASQPGIVTLSVKLGDVVKVGQSLGSIESVTEIQNAGIKTEPEVKIKKEEVAENLQKIEPVKLVKKEISKEENIQGEVKRLTKEKFLVDLTNHSTENSAPEIPKALNLPIKQQEKSERETRSPMSKIRKVIAQRLVDAQQTMAMLTTFNEVDLTQVIQLREKYKEAFAKKYNSKLGFMSFFVKATVSALQTFPNLNSFIDGDDIVHREYFDVGVAVGTEKGVIVPVIRDCDQLTFAEIEQEIEGYAKKARDGGLVVTDMQGGGFTITNGGVYGSLLSTPILLPPQCGILGMHKIEKRPVVINDQITIRSMMYLALSYDHRLVDGKEAVSFLVHIKNILEEPSRLLLDI